MKHIALIAKPSIKENAEILPMILDYLKKKNKKVCLGKHIPEFVENAKANSNPYCEDTDLVIVLGGDGTVLRTVRHLKNFNTLVFGINLGTLGFLSEVRPDYNQITATLDKVFDGEFTVDHRLMLEASIVRNKKEVATFLVLNEFTVSIDGISRLITLQTKVDNRKLATYHADGLIVATPTGSTGYSLSAGGPIVYPTSPSIILTPINPHSFTQKPIVIPDTKRIKISLESKHEKGVLTMDGQTAFDLEQDDVVKIRKYKETFKFVRLSGENYFRTIRKKLSWGKRLEA